MNMGETSFWDSVNSLLKTGVETWGAVEGVKAQTELQKAQYQAAQIQQTSGCPSGLIRNPITGQCTSMSALAPSGLDSDKTLLYIGIGAAALLGVFLIVRRK